MQVLLPENVARHNGTGAEIALESACGKLLLLTLDVTRIVEQESLEVSVWGSPNKSSWEMLGIFPKKDYCGTYTLPLDLTEHLEIGFLRAEWKLSRWGAGEPMPLVEFSLAIDEAKLHAVGA
jgi:hypothetical protein